MKFPKPCLCAIQMYILLVLYHTLVINVWSDASTDGNPKNSTKILPSSPDDLYENTKLTFYHGDSMSGFMLSGINTNRPRLLIPSNSWKFVRAAIDHSPLKQEWVDQIRKTARELKMDEPCSYEIPDGLRLLSTSRKVLKCAYVLSFIYMMDQDKSCLDRLWLELEAASKFPDWNPRHFLDTAEMTHAFAIAYDWLYDAWSPEQRQTIKKAMIAHGLEPALKCYRDEEKYGWWTKVHHNWNQVCNGGIGMGALAIAEEDPALCEEILNSALKLLPNAMKEYAPDGAYLEGPMYWKYGTDYNVIFLAALETALGTDFGLSQVEGFSETVLFPIYMTGPLNRTFNFGDASDKPVESSALFWLAKKFNLPVVAQIQSGQASPDVKDVIWHDPGLIASISDPLPLDKYFRKSEVVCFRSTWTNRNAVFLGFKGGDNKANHSNLDLGSFVLDANGYRWVVDLGKESYDLPGYFDTKHQRWTYYRMRAESHNCLVINPDMEPDQDPGAESRVIHFEPGADSPFAIAELTSAYARSASRVRRGMQLLNRSSVVVQDEIQMENPSEIFWFLNTAAEISLDKTGRTAVLTQGDSQLDCILLCPAAAAFEIRPASPLPTSPNPTGQTENQGIQKLTIHLKEQKQTRITVWLVPAKNEQKPNTQSPPTVLALEKWKNSR